MTNALVDTVLQTPEETAIVTEGVGSIKSGRCFTIKKPPSGVSTKHPVGPVELVTGTRHEAAIGETEI